MADAEAEAASAATAEGGDTMPEPILSNGEVRRQRAILITHGFLHSFFLRVTYAAS